MHRMLLFSLVIVATLASSCIVTNSKTGEIIYVGGTTQQKPNDYPYQPLTKPPEKVVSTIKSKAHNPLWPETFTSWMEWKSGWLTLNADETVEKSLSYLESFGKQYVLNETQMPIKRIPRDIRYPWKWDYYIIRWAGGYYDRSGKLVKPRTDILPVFMKTRTIVCIKPLVVVQTEGIIINASNCFTISNHIAAPYGLEIEKMFGEFPRMYVLKKGFAYGTRLPYDPEPQWFSPDMKTPLSPVDIDGNGVGRIAVPWGQIVLTKETDQWVASTESKRENK